MISYKQFIREKFFFKKKLKILLNELEHNSYYLNMNAFFKKTYAIHIKWYGDKSCIQIHEFREKFEDRYGDKYYLEYKESNIKNIEYYIIKR